MRIAILQEIVDILRGKILDLDIMSKKKLGIEKERNNIDTLILGSSHLKNAYIPLLNEYNLAISSQDLYYSYELLKKYDTKNIKNIIISFSVFSPGYQIIKTKRARQCLLYKLLFDIDYQFSEIALQKKLYKREKIYKYIVNNYLKKVKIREDYRGAENKYYVPKKKLTSEFVLGYSMGNLKNNQRKNKQILYAYEIIKHCKENGKNLFWTITPHTKEYRSNLPDKEILFEPLYNICKGFNNTKILNYYDNEQFSQEDFLDCDHLNEKGAQKFSKVVRKKIKKNNSC